MDRRDFLSRAGTALGLLAMPGMRMGSLAAGKPGGGRGVKVFLAGDVMTGRGIDQVLERPSRPELHEPYVRDARRYVELAERASGAIPRPVAPAYVWGDALAALERAAPDLRVVNLETAVTTSGEAWPRKGIHYRMHPANVSCLTAAGLECCTLSNNHVLDWGYAGLKETVASLRAAGLRTAGAGGNAALAASPAALELADGGRALVFAVGSTTSGIPRAWAAGEERAGVALLPDLSAATAERLAARIAAARRPGDLVVVSIHWGPNWGYAISAEHRRFAHRLIEAEGADVVHGHSSHHPMAIEVYRQRLILYGAGDLVNDYEGIGGREEYRPELALGYFASLEAGSGRLLELTMAPFRLRRFRLERAAPEAARWLADTLTREGTVCGSRVELCDDGELALRWEQR